MQLLSIYLLRHSTMYYSRDSFYGPREKSRLLRPCLTLKSPFSATMQFALRINIGRMCNKCKLNHGAISKAPYVIQIVGFQPLI